MSRCRARLLAIAMPASRAGRRLALALAIAWFGLQVEPARAEVRIAGTSEAVQIEMRDASLADVLTRLQATFKFQLRGATPQRTLSGSYRGPLRRVISQLLEGQNYIIRSSPDGFEVLILTTDATAAVAPPAPASRRSRRPAAAAPPPQHPPGKECVYDYGNGRIVPVEC